MEHCYNVNLKWTRDRKGVICSPELENNTAENSNCIEVATPPQFPKGMPNIWSPEHLFTAAVSSCLMTTFLAIADNSKLEFTSFKCESKGILEKIDGKFVVSEVYLFPKVEILDETKLAKTERILRKSKEACLITNSITSKIIMKTKVLIATS